LIVSAWVINGIWNWIITAVAPWMTARNAFYAQNAAFYRAVFSNGFKRIGGATGVEPTSVTDKWADEELIELYGRDDGDEGKPVKQ
jgi:hypothetical protein